MNKLCVLIVLVKLHDSQICFCPSVRPRNCTIWMADDFFQLFFLRSKELGRVHLPAVLEAVSQESTDLVRTPHLAIQNLAQFALFFEIPETLEFNWHFSQ